ncbi:MAG: chemotaxis protein CheW [Candidatus Latescibacterota bacterium]|nr:purine-binding chemotaxis protein CheW [Candidatus Latescibacterota bacterium]RKY70667.1 MAG: chemotaxis protein CheW [Candidatus Latescibacterota bacterium]
MAEDMMDQVESGDASETGEDLLQLVSFKIGEEEFGVDILNVREINRMVEITRVPKSPEYVEGVINLRGKVIPIVSLRKRMGMPEKEQDKDTRIVVVELEDQLIGFVVDAVSEVLRIPRNITEPPPETASGVDAEYITSIAKMDERLLILLNLNRLLAFGDREVLKEAA